MPLPGTFLTVISDQQSGDRRQLCSPHHPTPHTPHPTPHTLHPTPYTPHPTPHHPTPQTFKIP
ncbi:MAG: hypothetical protein EWV64_05255 [Microcystis flos-aquae Ma_QC_C_20070823_S18]|uniref:Uncharacterized protein n=1 Tax=Microcystis flos-aquae Mf_QC_C_20070823_S10D TaxID=2486236 RepID=A0A552L8P3_9CHRO|nr:MAG: hypothetical protein EWV64_05255 [Microcystis flos-aquae Ma_QC_C_20070823_S18]TRT93780.1 MAG: hypothetical protein EWV65_18130 [Microcystis flos-aquae Ma_QC_C_20070823_S18D]TRV16581.1 MAG: hypothetical protein EWV45_00190 [Microcystis flos-aquae Mf_QC_C_20070823_S10D]TRV36838.1 MAG: hypothetical protein EWV70_07870 [Microcystis flos-aquae Mf_QC_C_20070823_S20]